MSNTFMLIQGLRATCSQCNKEFPLSRAQQRMLFAQQPFPCPACACAQTLSALALDALKAKGNPGRAHMTRMGIVGGVGALFFAVMALGAGSDGLVMLGVVLFIATNIAISSAFKEATRDLRVSLVTPSGEGEPVLEVMQDR